MNNLYLFRLNEKSFYIAAQNWKDARNILIRMPEYKNAPLTDIIGNRVHKNCTDREGVLSVDYVLENLAWWTCKCGGQRFVPLDDGSVCRCINCGREKRNFISCP